MSERVALITSYYYDRKTTKPDFRGRVQVLAGIELFRQDSVDTLVLTGGKVNEDYSSLGETMADQANRIASVGNHLVISPVARSTYQEVREFKRLAELNGWNDLTIVCSEPHRQRVKLMTQKIFHDLPIKVVSSESILENKGKRYKNIIKELRKSQDTITLERQETLLRIVTKLPFGLETLETASRIFKNKGAIQTYVKDHLPK